MTTQFQINRWKTLGITFAIIIFAIILAAVSAPQNSVEPVYMTGFSHDDLRVAGETNQMAGARGAASYVLSGYSWTQKTVTYSVDNCPTSLDCTAAQQAVREAAAAWDAAANITLVEVPSGGDISVTWAVGGYGGRHLFDGKGGKVAQTYYPYTSGQLWYDGDIVLDDAETWVVGNAPAPFPQEVHLTSVVMHEMGHSLGLAHSPNRSALMWAYYGGVQGLTAHDIAGIQALYGAPTVASLP